MSSRRRRPQKDDDDTSAAVSEVDTDASLPGSRRGRGSTQSSGKDMENLANQAKIATAMGNIKGKNKKGDEEEKNKKKGGDSDEGEGDDLACWKCDKSLFGFRFVNKDAHPYCVSCYHDNFANKCDKCDDIITVDNQDLAFKDRHWHEGCFKCEKCSKTLVDEEFGESEQDLYCTDCWEKQFAPSCTKCEEPFKGGALKLSWNAGQWHADCFQCSECDEPIGQNSFHPHENKPFCENCWENNFAIKCTKCEDPIRDSGVTYKMEPYHRECFACSECDNPLAGQRFTLHEEKPVCADCFGSNYAHKCFECSLAISGVGGNRYIMFEDNHWHCECFYCKECNVSLLGVNFVADGDDDELQIYCQPCGFVKRGWNYDNVNVGTLVSGDGGKKDKGKGKKGSDDEEDSKTKKRGIIQTVKKEVKKAVDSDKEEETPPATPQRRRGARKT